MSPEQSLRGGQPDEALAQLQVQIRKDPSNPKLRVFLFQLLAVLGQWERALTQLKVIGELDASALAMTHTYTTAVQAEVYRGEVFAGRQTPPIFGEPPAFVALLFQALQLDARREHAKAQSLREQALEQATPSSGRLASATREGASGFEWVADADSRFGPMLEALINGRYYWVPFTHLTKLQLEAPQDLRDFVWTPGYVTFVNGGQLPCLIPTRYPGSETAADSALRLARKTEWREATGGSFFGTGQRMLATDTEEVALLDIREIEFDIRDQKVVQPDGLLRLLRLGVEASER